MRFSQAMAALEAGKKVRDREWPLEEYIYINSEGLVVKGLKEGKKFKRKWWEEGFYVANRGGQMVDERNMQLNLLIEDFEATDWIKVGG